MTKTNLVFNEQKTNNKRVQLVFPKSKGTDVHLPSDLSKYTGRKFFQLYCADTTEIIEWFGDFITDSIELWVNSIIQTEYETKLSVERKEGGGLKVVLKPKTNNHNNGLGQVGDKLLHTNGHMPRSDSD
jgi:hypothetical protein